MTGMSISDQEIHVLACKNSIVHSAICDCDGDLDQACRMAVIQLALQSERLCKELLRARQEQIKLTGGTPEEMEPFVRSIVDQAVERLWNSPVSSSTNLGLASEPADSSTFARQASEPADENQTPPTIS